MKYGCPNILCKNHQKNDFIIKNGRFRRSSDSRYVQKFKCKTCGKQFSKATFSLEKYQKKRRINHLVLTGLCSGVSMRRLAINLRVDKKTIKRKVDYLALKTKKLNERFNKKIEKSKVEHMQFDDLITIEHTKLKPLSVSLAVDANRRFILAASVSVIPAFGHLAELSRQKYGYRKSKHKEGLKNLFDKLLPLIEKQALIRSDQHKFYPEFTSRYFPSCVHETFKGGRGCVAGQGELKKLVRDPLFAINHTCAMLRANINRLIRKTWCTTKSPENLQKHLEIFIYYYNCIYLKDCKT